MITLTTFVQLVVLQEVVEVVDDGTHLLQIEIQLLELVLLAHLIEIELLVPHILKSVVVLQTNIILKKLLFECLR